MHAITASSTRSMINRSRVLFVALAMALGLFGAAFQAEPAEASHNGCNQSGGSHTHYHFPYAHNDTWHPHGFTSGSITYAIWHNHNHGQFHYVRCS
jgi:hypothetical protein